MASATPFKSLAHERDAAGFHGHVGARRHGDAEVGLRQRGRVVDAVAHHGHALARGLQFPDLRHFLLRQHFGQHVLDSRLARDRLGGLAVVAGDHPDLQAHGAQTAHGLRGFRLDGVGDFDLAGRARHPP